NRRHNPLSHNPLPRLTDCAAGPRQNRRRNHHYSTGQQHYAPLPFPRSLSVASSITNIGSGEDLHELMRAASVRYYGHENEAEMYVQQLLQIWQQEREASRSEKALPKSVSVGMGFMGMIVDLVNHELENFICRIVRIVWLIRLIWIR
ncbi:hypothetical protein LINPERPRIM_LOCUS32373, partial [Linum perenne]